MFTCSKYVSSAIKTLFGPSHTDSIEEMEEAIAAGSRPDQAGQQQQLHVSLLLEPDVSFQVNTQTHAGQEARM